MRNYEVQAYIERLYDALYSGLSDGDVIGEFENVLREFEDNVLEEMQAEADQKSGFDSTPFFTNLAESTYNEIINIGERMDSIHPRLGKFMQYLMEEDDPTFFIAYGDKPSLLGRSSDQWGYETSALILNHFLSNSRGDSDDK